MKGMSFSARLFLILLVTAVISGLLAKAFTNIAEREDPNFVDKAFDQIHQKFMAQKDFSESREEDLSDIKTLSISSVASDIVVEVYEGPTLRVEYAGKVSEKEDDSLISLQRSRGEVNLDFLSGRGGRRGSFALQWNGHVRGFRLQGDSHLEGKVYLPKSFHGDLRIRTTNGDIAVGPTQAGMLTVATISGDVELDHTKAGKINVSLVSGDLEADGATAKNWTVKNASGDVTLYLPDAETMNMDLTSLSGEISQGVVGESSRRARGEIHVKTISGDISIHRYSEEKEDRD